MCDAAAWVEAAGTWAAVGAAVYAGRQAWKVLKVERNRDERAQEDRQAAQASLVAAWPEYHQDADTGAWRASVVVGNGSSQPVYDLAVEYSGSGPMLSAFSVPVIPPASRRSRPLELGGTVPRIHSPEDVERVGVTITFRDAANRRWRRRGDGTLESLDR